MDRLERYGWLNEPDRVGQAAWRDLLGSLDGPGMVTGPDRGASTGRPDD
jgi:hypothetical protein